MNQVFDSNGNNYPFNVAGITPRKITGAVLGDATLNIVCAGPSRNGRVVDAHGNSYNVKLPGSFSNLNVTFNRI